MLQSPLFLLFDERASGLMSPDRSPLLRSPTTCRFMAIG
jgi:hypothetical protein